MLGAMMNRQLLIASIMRHAARYHTEQEVVSSTVEGVIHRYTYADLDKRSKQLANALTDLGINCGERIATLAWNTYRHAELYYGVSGMGAVCHTVNPRLFHDQLIYIFNHAADRMVFVDATFVPILEAIHDRLETVEHYVVLTDREHMPDTALPGVLCYEELVERASEDYDWPEFDENTASMLCYTSGTTGNPKGSLYSHRSTLLHALCVAASTTEVALTSDDSFLAIVPMFHVAAWGYAYTVPLIGSKLVLPGPNYTGEGLFDLMDQEQVRFTAGVPTIVTTLLEHMRKVGRAPSGLKRVMCGGSAPSEALIRAFEEDFGVTFIQGWGMTETSPVAAVNLQFDKLSKLASDDWIKRKKKQGRPNFGVETKIVDDDGRRVAEDGKATGELLVRGPFIVGAYYNDEEATTAAFDDEGWFRTGDVSSIDPEGILLLTDRSKDLIKSGGEWISSIDLENTIMTHEAVAEAAAIACHHPRWEERPLLLIVKREGMSLEKDEVLNFLSDKIVKWWMPDDVVFVDELPHGATGKVSKKTLREEYKDYELPTA